MTSKPIIPDSASRNLVKALEKLLGEQKPIREPKIQDQQVSHKEYLFIKRIYGEFKYGKQP